MSPLTHRISRSTWYLLVVIYVSMAALVFANTLYTNNVAESNARKWCHLLVTLDEAYKATPPRTDTGQRVADDIHNLRADLRCGHRR